MKSTDPGSALFLPPFSNTSSVPSLMLTSSSFRCLWRTRFLLQDEERRRLVGDVSVKYASLDLSRTFDLYKNAVVAGSRKSVRKSNFRGQ
jgi:hypothetical protein